VRDECDGAAGESGGELLDRREAGSGLKGEERGDGDADESVERIPDEIESGDFVDEEVDAEENEGGGDDAPVGEEMERRGKVEISGVGEQAESGYCGVDVEPGREADGDHEGYELVGRQGHGDSIEAARQQVGKLASQQVSGRWSVGGRRGAWVETGTL